MEEVFNCVAFNSESSLIFELDKVLYYMRATHDRLLSYFPDRFTLIKQKYNRLYRKNHYLIQESKKAKTYCSKIENFIAIGDLIKMDIEREYKLIIQNWNNQLQQESFNIYDYV